MTTKYLLIPLLIPTIIGISMFFIHQKTVRRRVLMATFGIELIFAYLATNIYSSMTFFEISGLAFTLRNDNLASIFSIVFIAVFGLASIFGFEYLHEHGSETFYAYTLFTLTAILGLCYSRNLFTFYLFYEAMTLLSFPLVLHERTQSAISASIKYLGYSLFGAALVLLGFFIISQFGSGSFVAGGSLSVGENNKALVLFAAFCILLGFAGKAGLMPLHDWLPTAHPEAPAPASALLSGVITKGGVLGIIRVIFYVFGDDFLRGTWVQYTFIILASLTIISGSMLAFREKLLKKRLAFSTVSQVSYVILGVFLLNPIALSGSLLQMIFHSICKVCLFLCAGAFICKTGKTKIAELEGIGQQMPLVTFAFAFASLSLVGLPPFAGFVSKWFLATGALQSLPTYGWLAVAVLLTSAALTGVYLLVPVTKAFFPGQNYILDAKVRCGAYIVLPVLILSLSLLALGLNPDILLKPLTILSNYIFT